MKHASYPDIIARLKRAHGHLASIITMFDEGRSCLEIAQQMHAVENAVGKAKLELIKDHIEHCLGDGVESGETDARSAVNEFRALAKYL